MDDRRGARFVEADFTGAHFHGVIFSDVTISDALLVHVDISGYVAGVTVNGVDVTGYVEQQLDERHPERVTLRAEDPDGMRHAWSVVESFAAATVAGPDCSRRSCSTSPSVVSGRTCQTLRHLVFATDRWLSGPLLGDPSFHPLGWPNDPQDEHPPGVFDLDAGPTLDEVLAVRRERMDRVATFLASATDADLARELRSPNGDMTTVRRCLLVISREEWWHDRYANRDLAILEQRR